MTTASTNTRDPEAPHGRAEDGTPLAPYGLKTNGQPRLSNSGRKGSTTTAAGTGSAPKGKSSRSADAAERERQRQHRSLVGLADMVLGPAMGAVSSDAVAKRLGDKRACALAGSVVILDSYVDPFAEQMVIYAASRPGFLGWLDTLETKAPAIGMMIVGAQAIKALAANWMTPDPRLAEAARLKGAMRTVLMAEAIEEEAARMGISLGGDGQSVPEPAEAAA